MRRYFNFITIAAVLLASLAGCKKDENMIIFQGGMAPVLSGTTITNTTLLANARNEVAFRLSWTNPNYMLNSGISSHNVSYAIEFDTTGANFTNPTRQTVSVSNDLAKTFTIGELNTVLAKMVLEPLKPHDIEVRVNASINGAAPLSSQVIKLQGIVPFEDFVIPAPPSNALFITGAATPGGWQAGTAGEAVPANQQFIQKSRSLYEIPSIMLNGGQSYLLLPEYGSWAAKYGGLKGNNENNPMEDDFKAGGSDLKSPPASGNYKIEVNFQTGRYKLTKL